MRSPQPISATRMRFPGAMRRAQEVEAQPRNGIAAADAVRERKSRLFML